MSATSVLRHSKWDGLLVALSVLHGAWLVAAPSVPLIALGLWWNANTVSHNFVHLPFFRSPRANTLYSAYLSLLLGFPQRLWRRRHLAHHAGDAARTQRWDAATWYEAALVLSLWTMIAVVSPRLFVFVYLPGYLAGLALCALQGHGEHANGTTSHYGRVYNWIFFNDGYHAEHHARPTEHWTRLTRTHPDARASRWPPVLRGCGVAPPLLNALERVVLRSPSLQRYVVRWHEAAMRPCLRDLPPIRRVTIIGGGLFPRTAIVLARLLPAARITIVDSDPRHLAIAQSFLGRDVVTIAGRYRVSHAIGADLLVVPLAFVGDRDQFYRAPPVPVVLVHDWAWRSSGDGVVVSWALLKRINIVRGRRRSDVRECDAADARISA